MAGVKKKVIKRKIDLNVVNSFDKDLKEKMLEFYTDRVNEQEKRLREKKILEAKEIFKVKKHLTKDLGNNDQERENKLALVTKFPSDEPTTEKGWSRVLGLMERGGSKKNKRVVEFPATKPKGKASPNKSSTKSKRKVVSKKK